MAPGPRRPGALRGVLITGASRGIGAAAAARFAEAGYAVALGYRSDRAAAETVLNGLVGDGHVLLPGDVAVEAERLAAEAARLLSGGLDVLVNNAAVRGHHPVGTVDLETWQNDWGRILASNLTGPAELCFHVARRWISEKKSGAIVSVSSRGAIRGEPDMPAYGVSKGGINAMTRSLAVALGPYGIHVSAVAPGFVETDGTAEKLGGPLGHAIRAQSPLGRVCRPPEVAEAIFFLAHAPMATGTILDLNGGSHLR